MARVAGIKFEKDTKGANRYVRIDLKKYGKEINPFLETIGAVEPDEFETLWANSLTVDEAKQASKDYIMSLDWDKITEKNDCNV